MRAAAACLVALVIGLPPTPAVAQTIGTFSWKLDPFCDVVTFTVTVDGPAFRLTGHDQPCGAAKVPAAGVVVPNPDGTFTLAFYLITAQGLASHTTATLSPPAYSGPWRDAGGQTGTLTFGAGSGGGAPRPIAPLQQRVAGVCTGSEFVQKVREDGSVECGAAPAGAAGDITGIAAGTGLVGGGSAGEVTLAIAPGGVGSAQIADGSIAAVDVNLNQIQRRIFGRCGDGLSLRSVDLNGNSLCWAGSERDTNVALGAEVLARSTGEGNTGIGQSSLQLNTTGFGNTAVGSASLLFNTTGSSNTAIGRQALERNTSGTSNLAVGDHALSLNTEGSENTALGETALESVTTGRDNIGIGRRGGANLTTGDNNIAIGHTGIAGDSDTMRIGSGMMRTFISGIRGRTTGNANAVAVLVDSSGQLGSVSSSRRTKEDIHDMGAASAGVFRLRPVTFRYRRPYADGSKPIDYGLIAEEVEEVYPDLVSRNEAGAIETVQYHKLTPMLLNEVQRLRRQLDAVLIRLADLEGSRR